MNLKRTAFCHTGHLSQGFTLLASTIFCVLVANSSVAFRFQGLIHDDPALYAIAMRQDITLWNGRVYWLFSLREAITSGLMLHLSPALARLFIIIVYFVPCILLSYLILRKYWSINRVSSVIASTFPFLLSFQTEIPLGINISYQIQDLLVALVSLYITLDLVSAKYTRPYVIPLFAVLFFILSEALVSSIVFIPVLMLVALSYPGENIKLRLATVIILITSLASIVVGELEVSRKTATLLNLSSFLTMLKVSLNSVNPFFYSKTVLRYGYTIFFWVSFCTGLYFSVSKCFSGNLKYLSLLVWSLAVPIWSLIVYSIVTSFYPPRYYFFFSVGTYWLAGFGAIILAVYIYSFSCKSILRKPYGLYTFKWIVYASISCLFILATEQKAVLKNPNQINENKAAHTIRNYFFNTSLMSNSQVLLVSDGFSTSHMGNPTHNLGYLRFLANNNNINYGIIAKKNGCGAVFGERDTDVKWGSYTVDGFSKFDRTYIYRYHKRKLDELKYLVAVKKDHKKARWELWKINGVKKPVLIERGKSKKEFIDLIGNLNIEPLEIAFGRALVTGKCEGIK